MTASSGIAAMSYAEAKSARREALTNALAINPPAPGVEHWTARYWALRAAMEAQIKTKEAA